MVSRRHRDIVIRGVTYPTTQAAAAALGVSDNTVMRAARLGRLDGVGLGKTGPVSGSVRVRGKIYPSIRAAAKALKLTYATVWFALEQGREDRVGLAFKRPGRSTPVQIGPYRFASRVEASRQLGFADSFVGQALRRKSKAGRQKILAAAMALELRDTADVRKRRQTVREAA
jgi:hypothetical protein